MCIETGNELKEVTTEKINLDKTGNFTNTSFKLFNDNNKNIEIEKINHFSHLVGAIIKATGDSLLEYSDQFLKRKSRTGRPNARVLPVG